MKKKSRPLYFHRIFQYIYFGQTTDSIQKLVINSKIFTVKHLTEINNLQFLFQNHVFQTKLPIKVLQMVNIYTE